jgi:YHS domain-containing protein
MNERKSNLKKYLGPLAALLVLIAVGVGVANQLAEEPSSRQQVQATSVAGLTRVEDVKKVCMVNNQVFDKDQIPVEVEGRMYYGCCEMCKERLAKDQAARTAIDPVSGKTVDKATAVIGALPDGKTIYFESETNLRQYASTL